MVVVMIALLHVFYYMDFFFLSFPMDMYSI